MSGKKSRHLNYSVHRVSYCQVQTSFADLVVLAGEFHPIPFRTRPLKPPAPMVLRPKPRESRSLPGLRRTETPFTQSNKTPRSQGRGVFVFESRPLFEGGPKSRSDFRV